MATGGSLTDSTTLCRAKVPDATIYSPLEPGQTRVLHLQPAREVTAPLVGVFEVIEVGSGAEYEALSYTWDEPFDDTEVSKLRALESSTRKTWTQKSIFSPYQFEPGEIWIYEVAVRTTANLHVALRRLRYADGNRTLWVDAICINQDDLMERSAQVACMARIFSGASQVVAWIGEDSGVKDGQRVLRYCCQNTESRRGLFSGSLGRRSKQLELLRVFEARRYFKRRWCIQEMTFAQCALLKCGPLEIPWFTFVAILGQDQSFDYSAISTLGRITKEKNTVELMILLSPWKCLDKRDFIYSVASILKLCPDCPQITTDYTLHWTVVYPRFARDYIQLNGYFAAWNILIIAGFQLSSLLRSSQLPTQTPTWVPDWTDFGAHDFLLWMDILGFVLASQYYVMGDNTTVTCDDRSIEMNLRYLGQMEIAKASEDDSSRNDRYYGVPTKYNLGEKDATLILRRCGEKDMTFQLVGCERAVRHEWSQEAEMHRVTIM